MESPLRPQDRQPPSSTDIDRAKELTVARLHERGIEAPDDARAEQLVALLEAVESFEAAAAARACDSFTNALDSASAEDPDCVLPRQLGDESIETYTLRVRQSAEDLARPEP